MDPDIQPVKSRRPYDSRRRRDGARRHRESVLDAARLLFLRDGYAATSVPAVARAAQVSVETVYKAFGGKAGLVRALQKSALAGVGPVTAPVRSDAMSADATDPVVVIREWARLTMEVAPRFAPIALLVRSAAAADPQMADLLAEHTAERLSRMTDNAHCLADRGWLRNGLTVASAAAVMCVFTAPEVYELLVVHQGWTIDQFGDFVYRGLTAELLASAVVCRSGVAAPPE